MSKETDLKKEGRSRRSSLLNSKRRSSQHPKSLTNVDYLPGLVGETTPEEKFVNFQVACFKVTAQSIAECSRKFKILHHQLIVRGDEASEEFRIKLQLKPKAGESIQSGKIEEPHFNKIDAYIKKLENETQAWHEEVKKERVNCERLKMILEKGAETIYVETTTPKFNYAELNERISNSFIEEKILEKFERQKLRELEKVRDLLKRKNDDKFDRLVKLATLEICNA